MHEAMHLLQHAFKDTYLMFPFLYLTYLLMEYIEHKGSNKMKQFLISSQKFGPLIAAGLGLIPHCGFSIMASGFYLNKTISLGTLLAVFIATSDEAIPIFIAMPNEAGTLGKVLLLKFIVAVIFGYFIDLLVKNQYLKQEHAHHGAHEHCEEEAKKHPSIYMIAFIHAIKVFIFIFVVNLALSIVMEVINETTIQQLLQNGSIIQVVIASIVGLIPNCASSIVLTSLYAQQSLSFSALFAGLVSSSGLGILALMKMYDNKKDVLRIIILLLICAILSGSILQLISL